MSKNVKKISYREFSAIFIKAQELYLESHEPIPEIHIGSKQKVEYILNIPFQNVFNTELYKDFYEKASALFYFFIKNHPLINGNKRMACYLLGFFFEINNKIFNIREENLYKMAVNVAKSETSNSKEVMKNIEKQIKTKDCKSGCYFGGNRPHSSKEGGIPAIVTDSDKQILVESQEVVINKKSVQSDKTHTFDGKPMKNKQILNEINTEDGNGVEILEKGGEIESNKETYEKWKSLVNMSKSEVEKFYNSKEGKEAGLSTSEAKAEGISSGRESARWIMKMKDKSYLEWTPEMWKWANKQISFISRMSANKGGLYDDNGNKTRKHTSLLIWGHNPKENIVMEEGGEIKDETLNFKVGDQIYLGFNDDKKRITKIDKENNRVYLAPLGENDNYPIQAIESIEDVGGYVLNQAKYINEIAKNEAEYKDRIEKEAKEKQEYEDIKGFASDKKPLERGLIIKRLQKRKGRIEKAIEQRNEKLLMKCIQYMKNHFVSSDKKSLIQLLEKMIAKKIQGNIIQGFSSILRKL